MDPESKIPCVPLTIFIGGHKIVPFPCVPVVTQSRKPAVPLLQSKFHGMVSLAVCATHPTRKGYKPFLLASRVGSLAKLKERQFSFIRGIQPPLGLIIWCDIILLTSTSLIVTILCQLDNASVNHFTIAGSKRN